MTRRQRPTSDERIYALDTATARIETEPGNPRAFTLYLDDAESSHIDLDRPERLEFEYMQHMASAIASWPGMPEHSSVLHLGGAACTFPRALASLYPASRHLVVELDAAMAALAREISDLPRSPRLRIRVGEAREVTRSRPDASADVVVRDVFADRRTPGPLTSVEFTREVRRVLRPGGLYLANSADQASPDRGKAEAATLLQVFSRVYVIAEPSVLRGRRRANVIVAGTDEELDEVELSRRLNSLSFPARYLNTEDARVWSHTIGPLWDSDMTPTLPPVA